MLKRLHSLCSGLLLAAAFAVAAIMLAPPLLGYERYVITGASMSGAIPVGSVVYARPVPVQDLRVGDVITYTPPADANHPSLVTHRIASVGSDARTGDRVFRTKGDANASVDPWTFSLDADLQPRVDHHVPLAGHVLIALSEPRTRMVLIGGPALLIAVLVLLGLWRDERAAPRSHHGHGQLRVSLRRAIVVLALLGTSAASAAGIGASGADFTASSTNPQEFRAADDYQAPTVSVTDPGSPLRSPVTVGATASDNGAIASVRIQSAPAGSGTFTDLCTDAVAPYSCTQALDDGLYDLRAIALDTAGNAATSATVGDRRVDSTAPVAALVHPGDALRGTFDLTATATDTNGSGVATLAVERSPAGAGAWTRICTSTTSPASCPLDTVAAGDGVYDLRVRATDAAGNAGSALVEGITFDNSVPAVTMTPPPSPMSGLVMLSADASDPGTDASGVASVVFQRAPSATPTAWVAACTATGEPWSCRWDSSSVASGTYVFRAIATDAAGNATTSASTPSRTVDNTSSTITMEDPGTPLRGTVTLAATATAPLAGATVAIQISPGGANAWSTVCTDATAPYTCSLDTTTKAFGSYDFRAQLTEVATKTSNVVASRTIDNTPLAGIDVQALNGGALGTVDKNDSVTLTYSTVVRPESLVAGWTGAAAQPIVVQVVNNGPEDRLAFFTDASRATPVNLGTVNLKSDQAGGMAPTTFAASLTQQTVGGRSVFTVTLGTRSSGGPPPPPARLAKAMVWTPSASATTATGSPSSTTPITESGTLDRDL